MCGFPCSDQWWLYQPEGVLDNSDYKLFYDFNIFTDHKITIRYPDLVLMDKQLKCTKLIDAACMMDRHVVEKHRERQRSIWFWHLNFRHSGIHGKKLYF